MTMICGKLVGSIGEAKEKGQKIGKIAKIRGLKLGEKGKNRSEENSIKKDYQGKTYD
ncbi:MAG: hypothetical protein CM1200mP23_0060 [Nitrososphaerota archaeon]|nr:MAG: hypothetical protein CM1200mP23_0060 [Nitrososphaerota archaeon]